MPGRQSVVCILPARDEAPVGGYKVVYTYAEMLSRCGCDVHLVYPHIKPEALASVKSPLLRLKMRLGFFYRLRIRKQLRLGNWFRFKEKVCREYLFTVSRNLPRRYPRTAVFVATAVETSYWVAGMRGVDARNGCYFIQDFENWKHDDGYVLASYRLPLRKAVISSWLRDKLLETGEEAVLVPNAIDPGYFSLATPIEERSPFEVAFLYHTDDRKRTGDVLAALDLVRKAVPQLHAVAFGVEDRPSDLPSWCDYCRQPDREEHNRIYNRAAIFVAASRAEGWGLTVCEAMQCGCAVACTDAGGFREFCTEGKTALMSPVFDVEALAENVRRLVCDGELRVRLAKAGMEGIGSFTWESSFDRMRKFLGVCSEL